MKNTSVNVGKMVRLAVLVAVIFVMQYTPLGYLKIGALEITFLMIPVAVAAVIVGPAAGAIAGGFFGLTSFLQCFGQSWFGSMLFNISPVFTFIICMIPRILAGLLPGLIYKGINKLSGNKTAAATVASFSAAILNTILFVGTLFLLFGSTDFIKGFGDTTWAIIVTLVGTNALVEMAVCTFVGAAVSRALIHFVPLSKRAGAAN